MTDQLASIRQLLPGYAIGEEIGRGAWGIVYEGRHRYLDRQVAVKVLPRAFGADPAAKQRFLVEAKLLAALEHPHLVPVYDYAEDGGLCLLVLELLTGGTLWQRMSNERLSPTDAVAVALAMCAGLHHAHERNVLHRDVKPDNVIFAASGRPKVADFGIAKLVGDDHPNATRAGDVLGTPAYMAPEQARGGVLSPATDVYAVGVVLYELLAGCLPFDDDGDAMAMLWHHVHDEPAPLVGAAPDVPPAIAASVHRSLAKAPDDRPGSAEALAIELAAAAARAWGGSWLEHAGVPVEVSPAVRAAAAGRGRAAPASLPPPPPGPPPPGPPLGPPPGPPPNRGAPTVVVSVRTPDPAEERALRLAESGGLRLDPDDVEALRRLFTAPTDEARLGLAANAGTGEVLAAALNAVGRWRVREDDPFATSETREVCAAAIRACEAIHHAVRRRL